MCLYSLDVLLRDKFAILCAFRKCLHAQIELYQLSPGELDTSAPTRQFLTMKLIDTYREGWENFDVTSTIRHWIRNPSM